MTRADAASLITCGVFVAGILTGVNPGNAQPWVGMEGFRVEASHDGLALSDEEDPREYTPFSPARDGWALGDGQIRGVARFEDFPYTRARPRAGVLDLLLSTLGSGRPRFEFSARGGGRFEITRLDDAFRVHKTVSLPEGARPRAYLHVLAPAGTLTIHLDGVAVARPTSTEGERTLVSESADITVVSLVTGRGWRVERPPGARAYLNSAAYQIELEGAFELAGSRASSTLIVTPLRKTRG